MQNVFIALRVPGEKDGRLRLVDVIQQVVSRAGCRPFVAYQEISRSGMRAGKEFMPFVRQHMQQCALVIVAYDQDLRGGLVEAGMAYAWGLPIWVLHRRGERVSNSLLGCAALVIEYYDLQDLDARLAAGFEAWNLTNSKENQL